MKPAESAHVRIFLFLPLSFTLPRLAVMAFPLDKAELVSLLVEAVLYGPCYVAICERSLTMPRRSICFPVFLYNLRPAIQAYHAAYSIWHVHCHHPSFRLGHRCACINATNGIPYHPDAPLAHHYQLTPPH